MAKVLQMGYMSGDTYTAAVWLKLNSGSKIIVVKDTKEPQDKTDKVVLPFYRECGVARQVSTLDISKTRFEAKSLWALLKDASTDARALNAERMKTPAFKNLVDAVYDVTPRGWPRGITAVTGWVANAWNADPKTTGQKIAAMWKVVKIEGELFQALDAFLNEKFGLAGLSFRDNFVVLWSRQSGKRGGAHLELDSGYEGIRQLARHFAITKGNATVLLAGDETRGKLAALAAEHPQIANVSNLWEEAAWKKEPLKSSPYLGQFAFFKHMADNVNVVHVGMRSGILEAMALMGMKTFYMEPAPCPSGDRMVAFAQAHVPYTRIQIHAPAGLTAWNAQQAIRKGIPAPSLGHLQDSIQGQIQFLMRSKQYQNYYYSSGRGGGRPVFRAQDARNEAVVYAKAKVLAEASLDRSAPDYPVLRNAVLDDLLRKAPDQVKNDMRATRGFYNEDLKKITDAVEAALKK